MGQIAMEIMGLVTWASAGPEIMAAPGSAVPQPLTPASVHALTRRPPPPATELPAGLRKAASRLRPSATEG